MARPRIVHWKRWLGIGIAAAALFMVGAPYAYIHFIQGKAPAPLSLSSPSVTPVASASSSAQPSGSTDGTWKVAGDSIVGYRIKEVLFGQSNVAVGRTSDITGSLTVEGTTISSGTFTVDMTTVASDESRRDGQFNGRIMETGSFPTATFTLTDPIDLGSIPDQGVEKTFQAKGNLTLHGVTRSVTFTVKGRYDSSSFQVVGSIPVTFADYNISNPSFGAVTTEDHGLLEFSLNFTQA
jgi:polyisoprenoid-binding protein YceI